MVVQAHPIGILLGLFFVTCVGGLFLWMFRVPPVLPLPVIKVRRSVQAMHRILVPIVEAISSERAVEIASRLGHDQNAELVLVHVIVVPFTMALDAPLPEREKVAHQALELGCLIAQRLKVHAHTRIVRHRNAAEGILQTAREEEVDAIVLGVGEKQRIPGEWGRTSQEILRRAPCEVLVDRVPISGRPMALTT